MSESKGNRNPKRVWGKSNRYCIFHIYVFDYGMG